MLAWMLSCWFGFALGYICCALLSSYKEHRLVKGKPGDSIRIQMSDGTVKTYILAATWHMGDEYVVLQVTEGSKNVTFAVKSDKATKAFSM
jgi:hypothetical protein